MYRHWSFPDSQSSSLKISIISYCESYIFLQCIVCVFQKMWFKITRKLSFSPSVAHEHELQLMFCLLLFPSGESRTLLYHFSDYFSFVLEASLLLLFCSFACKIKIYAKNVMFFLFRLLITLALLSLNEPMKREFIEWTAQNFQSFKFQGMEHFGPQRSLRHNSSGYPAMLFDNLPNDELNRHSFCGIHCSKACWIWSVTKPGSY